ncbi:hypothetical protein [Endozoicomonas sp. 8E]|uniref:hypothetical protein n=1 Tax=Endozoicomonas sp. 8E TaxID=3035692 RepID=UPI0029393DB2|nr:hypothetical protein [Endozoicomonas sp. 8E]WOG29558.1 hypothetical protein P6910_07880 [Endozoicomonas sp. 8E]
MTNTRPNALSLAVAIAISSSIIGSQALADRKLQIKAANIPGNGHVEITLSEVRVQPTLGDDQQPIPKSITTTYPAQPRDRYGHHFNSVGFTEVLADCTEGVSVVDVFATDENDVAQKYTKVLKMGDDGIFRFTHNLAENELVIEVKDRMTDQDILVGVHSLSSGGLTLEPLTKIASSREMFRFLSIVYLLKGWFGASDHYVPLATIKVEKVAVDGRTFMRLIAAGDQPPDLQRLGQTVFVNDDVLLAAAVSAYIQVYILEEDLQQQALNELLAHSKPVGYVVHVEDDSQVYPVPAGYPKLEVAETPGEVIVFHGQMQSPDNIAFVESLHNLWKEAQLNNPTPEAAAVIKVLRQKVRSYQYVIRSKQMALLEEVIARHGTGGFNKDQPPTMTNEDREAMHAFGYYEFLQQALVSATPPVAARTNQFGLTLEHIRLTSLAITPTWQQIQLAKYFSFKPILRDSLTEQHFVKSILNHLPSVDASQRNALRNDDPFLSKVLSDMTQQLIEWESSLAENLATKGELIQVRKQLKLITEKASKHEEEKLRTERLYRLFESELTDLLVGQEDIRTPVHPEAMPEVIEKLTAVEKALAMNILGREDDLYYRREAISGEIQRYITKVSQQAEGEALKDANERAIRQQKAILKTLEDRLNIDISENSAAKKRGKTFTEKLAEDLHAAFDMDDDLSDQKNTLRTKIQELIEKSEALFDDEAARRAWNNEIAQQLNIEDYKADAPIKNQNRVIATKLRQLDKEWINEVQPEVNDRIVGIENELDRQMARLGSKPRYVLERELTRARQTIQKSESGLERMNEVLRTAEEAIENDVGPFQFSPGQAKVLADMGTFTQQHSLKQQALDAALGLAESAVNSGKVIPELTTFDFDDEFAPIRLQALVGDELTFNQASRIVEVFKSLKRIFPLTPVVPLKDRPPGVAKKQQALDAALGQVESTINTGKTTPNLATFDFDDEFAPLGLQAMVRDDLTFDRAGQIVQVFKSLKMSFPAQPLEGQPENVIQEVQNLAHRARNEMKTGAKQYDDEIHSMGKRAIHFVDHEPKDLKDFSEYFEAHSASGNRIIALLREGLISKIELENYMEAVRGVDGYQTVDEFEHFLGFKHGIHTPEFRKVVQMLSDQGAEEFMESAFTPVAATATGPAGMKESVTGTTEYAAAVIANYVLDDIAFDNGRRTAAFLANVQETLTPYANAVGLSESELIQAIHDTLMQVHAAAVERQLSDYWVKPSAFLVQAVTWYFSSYKPLLVAHSHWQAAKLSLANMSFLYLLDLTNRGDYLHRMLTPFQHWLEPYGVDPDRTGQYAYHSGIEQIAEVGGLAMPLGKAASSVILLRTGSALFARQYNANPHSYRSISRLVPEIVRSMGSGQGVQVPLLNRVTPQKVKTLASATAGLVLGPIATAGAYAHGLISGFTYAQTFGFALASSLTFDFFMNDNKMLTQWLGGPLGRSLDRINRWRGVGETRDEYVKRTAIATPQRYSETDEEYANRVKTNDSVYGWTRHENYLQFLERRDRTMKLFENSWEQYFRENVPKWSLSHAESIPYSYTLGAFFESGTAAPEAPFTVKKAVSLP